MSILDKGYISLKNHAYLVKESLKSDERGVSGIVATIILVLIAVVVAMIFWDNIKSLIDTLWSNVTSADETTDIKRK